MEVTSSSKTTPDLQVSRKWKGRDHHHHQQQQQQQITSPERTKVWTEPNKNNNTSAASAAAAAAPNNRKVPVIYYISRNGQLEHPHFMDVPLSSPEGLYLKDVIHRLNLLRGEGMASMYSWSSKRNYKNGFVWHDLTENDFIHPAHGQEYVLKGSEIIDPSSLTAAKHLETAASSSFRVMKSGDESADFPVITRRRNQSWSNIDLNEYKVYKAEPNSESSRRLAADASTQTDDKRRRRRPVKVDEEEEQEQKSQSQEMYENQTSELSREDISPPPSDSSPETLESLMKADGRLILCSSNGTNNNDDVSNRTADNYPSGQRMKASTVLMQLISCGSISFKGCGPGHVKDQGFSLIGQYKARLPRVPGDRKVAEAVAEREIRNFARVRMEDKEYFSGSLIETNKKEEVPSAMKRSNSCNADRRSSQLQLAAEEGEEMDGVRAKCIPTRRKPESMASNKESSSNISQHHAAGNKSLEVSQAMNRQLDMGAQ